MSEPTQLLRRWQTGDQAALIELMEVVYKDLRTRAGKILSGQSAIRLQPTELVNESFIKLATIEGADWQDRAHFLAVAAKAMRQVLLDQVKYDHAAKRARKDVTLVTHHLEQVAPADFCDLDDALRRLSEIDEGLAQIVELKFFSGMSNPEIAAYTRTSESTVKRQWRAARAWLLDELSVQPEG
ncbi:MAG: ECF-type sigma factor [Pseudomonadales bacterium]